MRIARGFTGPFRQRLATLSRVQGLLSRSETSPVTIGEVVVLELHALGAANGSLNVWWHVTSEDGPRTLVRYSSPIIPGRYQHVAMLRKPFEPHEVIAALFG